MTYTTPRVTVGTRKRAYELLADLFAHLPNLGVDIVSVVRNSDNSITITLTGPLSADQREHLIGDAA